MPKNIIKRESPKWLIPVILLIVVAGVVSVAYGKGTFFKGQLMLSQKEAATVAEKAASLPDLQADIALASQPKAGEDLQLVVTIKNLGPGALDGKVPFKYAIDVNGEEVFSNTDSYSILEVGDSFSFNYPAPKALYNYADKGTITFKIDTAKDLDEVTRDNNTKEIPYSY
jgi:hypothetical protein